MAARHQGSSLRIPRTLGETFAIAAKTPLQKKNQDSPTCTQTGTHCCDDDSDPGVDGGDARYSASLHAISFTKSMPRASSASSVNARQVHTTWWPSGETHTSRFDELLLRSSAALPQLQVPMSSA
eukprot:CAMPEP_0115393014 /NCGR_PEP_ID=MMETSP0271-20121206/11526_1 /TAXON_ID=71861 /ORGANISM="Scrippsiella trochoidea, Strain CCMP3099" /LENGTH=124 /DNA_ID=CAMNT_0002816629 /DNA_START=158 /DNA_END=532 /DNA_ORIENTATION=-